MNSLEIARWFSEGGIVETATVIAYFVCAALMILKGGLPFLRQHAYLPVLVILMALRELDFDKKFTAVGILKSRFFGSAEVSLFAKFVGLCVLLLLLWAVVNLVRHHVLPFVGARFHAVRAAPPHLYFLTASLFGLLIFAKLIDGLESKIPGLSLEQARQVGFWLMPVEEVAEMLLPLLIAAIFLLWWRPHGATAAPVKERCVV